MRLLLWRHDSGLVRAVCSISLLLSALPAVSAVELDITSIDSVRSATSLIAKGLMDYYDGSKHGGVVGMMTNPYYWWEAGAAWNSMLDYWYVTGNDTWNDILKQSLLYQVGENKDYMPSNQSTTEGNDDQGFWGITAMAAAERNFSNPDSDQPGWLYLAQAVFNTMASRWDDQHCGGGLRWQIYQWNAGYDYKNTVSNGCMFNLAARLARYTNNQTYVDWAEKIYDWLISVEFLMSPDSPSDFRLYDGASLQNNCEDHTIYEWTYNYGLLLSGCAFLYDYTNNTQKWETRATTIWGRANIFFENKVMFEAACNPAGRNSTCNNDQRCFKAIFSRFIGHVATFIPSMRDDVMGKLNASAAAAAQSCSGGTDGHTCGLNWRKEGWDGVFGLGEQMSALEVIQNTQILSRPPPLSNRTGGTSNGSSTAGTTGRALTILDDNVTVTGADRAGAGIVTAVCLVGLIGIGAWMIK